MIAASLLTRLTGLGVSAEVDNNTLRLRPASVIPAGLLAEVRENKDGLLALLTASAAIDLGELPAGRCPICGTGRWWRISTVEPGGPGPWRCQRCERPNPAVWQDGHAAPVQKPP